MNNPTDLDSASFETKRDVLLTVLWIGVLLGQLLIPLAISVEGRDPFRYPKEIALRGQGILLIGMSIAAFALRGRFPAIRKTSFPVLLSTLIVLWTAISTLLSTNVLLSRSALITVVIHGGTFLLISALATSRSLDSIYPLLIAASLNCILAILQFMDIWRPFLLPDNTGKISITGLLGGPTDVAVFLMIPSIAALSLAVAVTGWRRYVCAATFALLSVGIVMCQNLTVLMAWMAGLLLVSLTVFRKRAVWMIAIAIPLLFILLLAFPPLRERSESLRESLKQKRYNELLSLRLTAFMAASQMFAERPLAGMGPDTFHWHYFPYNLALIERHPELLPKDWQENFGEVHNEHLQLLAEAGVPAYLLFLAGLTWWSLPSFQRSTPGAMALPDVRDHFLRISSLPFAASAFILSLAQFPLHLAAVINSWLFLAALRAAWWTRRR